jgi:rod shape-determining protein MreC
MFDPNSPEFTRPMHTLPRAGPSMQAFLSRHRPFVVLVAVLVAQLLLLSVQITRNRNVRLIRLWTVAAVDPFERGLRGALDASTEAWRTYRSLWHAQQENRELRLELASAQSMIRRLSEQAGETQRLRVLLDLRNQLPFQTLAAEVIAASPGDSSRAIFIDKGSDSGLVPDLAVLTPQGVVGKIVDVFPFTSHVLLLTDASSGVGIMLGKTRVQGVLKGGTQNLCQLEYIMNEVKVSPGEEVLTSGLDQIYPKGLLVGTVLQATDGNIYKNILVKPAVDLSRLENVLVVLKPPEAKPSATKQAKRP